MENKKIEISEKDSEILVFYKNKSTNKRQYSKKSKIKYFTDWKKAQKFADANDGEICKIINGALREFKKTYIF